MIKRLLTLLMLVIAATALCAADAEARRMGGGRSFGAQRSIAPQPAKPAPSQAPANAAPPTQSAPTGNATATPRQPVPPAAPSGASRWLGPLAGIAAGIGLAALLSHFGLSGDFAGILLALLAVGAGVFLLRRIFARPVSETKPLAYAGNASPTERIEPVLPSYQGHAVSAVEPAALPAEFDAPEGAAGGTGWRGVAVAFPVGADCVGGAALAGSIRRSSTSRRKTSNIGRACALQDSCVKTAARYRRLSMKCGI